VDEDREDYTEWHPEPPPTIDPGAKVDWKLDSAGTILSGPRGVEGHVRYRIEDKDHFFGADSHPGKQGCLYLYWDNPVIGNATFNGPPFFSECPSELGSGDPSTDYTIYRSFGMGGEGDKWTEWVLAAGLGPLDLWHSIDPVIFLTLKTKVPFSTTSPVTKKELPTGFIATLPEPVPLRRAPINLGTGKIWSKTWINAFTKEKAFYPVIINLCSK
jgi:hypothetical protein